jgi:GNAT superfamily N-acetyltransferase
MPPNSEGADLRVRPAEPDDAEAMVQLTASGWRTAYRGMVPDSYIERLPISGWRHDIAAGLRSPEGDSFTWIADVEGGAAGYCFVAAPGREEPKGSRVAELVAIYVEPSRWGQGLGRALMESSLEEATRHSYEEIVLWTFERNERARAFYDQLGWHDDGARRPHRASGAATLRFRRSLP